MAAHFRWLALALAVSFYCCADRALSDSNAPAAPGLLQRVESFGERIVSGIGFGKSEKTPSQRADSPTESGHSGRAGSAFKDPAGAPIRPRPDPLVNATRTLSPGETPPGPNSLTPATIGGASPRTVDIPISAPVLGQPTRNSAFVQTNAPAQASQSHQTNAVSTSGRQSLHDRLSAYRNSPFSVAEPPLAAEESAPKPSDRPSEAEEPRSRPASAPRSGLEYVGQQAAIPTAPVSAEKGVSTYAPSPAISPARAVPQPAAGAPASGAFSGQSPQPRPASSRPQMNSAPTPASPVSPSLSAVDNRASTASQLTSGGSTRQSSPASLTARSPIVSENTATLASPGRSSGVTQPRSASSETSEAVEGSRGPGRSVSGVISTGTPALQVEAIGPPSITLGKPGRYEIMVRNLGGGAADQIRVSIAMPPWAELVGLEASAGASETSAAASGTVVVWSIPTLGVGQSERLLVQLVPRESRAIELALQYAFAPPVTQTKIEVREPKLDLRVDGPREVLYGRSEVYRVELINTGTAEAEDVVLAFRRLRPEEKAPITQAIGVLAPGEKRVVELELLAREAGPVLLQVEAKAASNISASVEQEIVVVKPDLEVAIEGPALQFVGEKDQYVLVISNSGTAPAENVRLVAQHSSALQPEKTGLGGARIEGQKVEWVIPSVKPGEKQTIPLPCRFTVDGEVHLTVRATAEGGLQAESAFTTTVQAMPNLVLRVEDPGRPTPLGQEGMYQIFVENKGSKAANQVQIVGFFSEGIEPIAAEGLPHKILAGQVIFETVDRMEPGQKLVLRVRARAEKTGNHIFRAELRCPSLEIQLASEASTHYFDPTVASRGSSTNSQLR